VLFLRFCLVCAVLLTVAPFFAVLDARAAAFQALALHLIAINGLLALVLLIRKRRILAMLGLLAALWNIAVVWPSVAANMKSALADPPAKSRVLKVISFNLSFDNQDPAKVADYLAKSGADVIGLAEVTPEAKAFLAKLKPTYPHSIDCIGQDRFCELMLLSKKPLRYPFAGKVGPKLTYIASADIDWQGNPISIAMTHIVLPFVKPDWPPLAPWIQTDEAVPLLAGTPALWQSMQASVVAGYARTLGQDQIVMGDFNSTPWSDVQVAFRNATALDSRGPLVASWPASLPAPLRIPIDPVFVGGGLSIRDLRAGPNLGSDHLPMIAEIGSKRPIAEAE
jgi:endonuclease/exonuclease/phosphatase (EEP) superfamily protein YafD